MPVSYIKGDIRELKLDIQELDFAIEEAFKTKNPERSFRGKKQQEHLDELTEQMINRIKHIRLELGFEDFD